MGRDIKKDASNYKKPSALDDSDEMGLDVILQDVVGQTLSNKMSKSDPEYKTFKESYDKSVEYFLERINRISESVVHEVFKEFAERVDDIVTILSRDLLEFCQLSDFSIKCLGQLNPVASVVTGDGSNTDTQATFPLLVDTLAKIGNKLLNQDPAQVELFFLEHALSQMAELMFANTFRRNEMNYLLYCFVSHTSNSHLRVLSRLKELAMSDPAHRDAFYHILARLILYEGNQSGGAQVSEGTTTQELAPELYEFYFTNACTGLNETSPVTRTKCITILSYLSKIRIEPVLPLL
jgi:hypothetical protein